MTDKISFKIEDGIDIPTKRHKISQWGILAETMNDKSSILVKTNSQKQSLTYAISKINGFKYVSRKQEGGIRVWKVKDDR